MQLLQSCFISSKLLLQDLKFDIVHDDGVSLQKIKVYMRFQKEVPVVDANGPFYYYPNIAPAAALQACIFLKKIVCRVHKVMSKQIKCKANGIFKSFFNLRVHYYAPNLFCPFDHLPAVAARSRCLICLYSLTLNLT